MEWIALDVCGYLSDERTSLMFHLASFCFFFCTQTSAGILAQVYAFALAGDLMAPFAALRAARSY